MPNVNESTNPCIEIPPEFLQLLDESNQVILNKMWHLPDVSKANKLQFIDTFMTTQSDQVQKSYRKWRFEINRETIPEFVMKQTAKMQTVLKLILSQRPSLDEFYEYLLELRTSLKEYDEFLKWVSAEHLDLPDTDEIELSDSNKSLDIQLALQSKQYEVIKQYNQEVEQKLRSQLPNITMDELSASIFEESILCFYGFSTLMNLLYATKANKGNLAKYFAVRHEEYKRMVQQNIRTEEEKKKTEADCEKKRIAAEQEAERQRIKTEEERIRREKNELVRREALVTESERQMATRYSTPSPSYGARRGSFIRGGRSAGVREITLIRNGRPLTFYQGPDGRLYQKPSN